MCKSCKCVTDIPLTLDVIPIRDLTLTVFAPTFAVLVSVKEFVMRVLMWRCNDRVRRDGHCGARRDNPHRGSRTKSNQHGGSRTSAHEIRSDYHRYSVDLFGAGSSNRPGRHHHDSAVSCVLGR